MRSSFSQVISGFCCLLLVAEASPLQSRVVAVDGYSYQGCYTEGNDVRALSGNAYYDDEMTVQKCAAACADFSTFGIE